jgi:hypothetical protein
MKNIDAKLRKDLITEITNSNMNIQRKLKVMRLLDEAFRKYLGIIYLSDKELEQKDILNRSM